MQTISGGNNKILHTPIHKIMSVGSPVNHDKQTMNRVFIDRSPEGSVTIENEIYPSINTKKNIAKT